MIKTSKQEICRQARRAVLSKIFLKVVGADVVTEIGDTVILYDRMTDEILSLQGPEITKQGACDKLNILRGNFYRWREI